MPVCEVVQCPHPSASTIYTAAGSQHALCAPHAESWEAGYRHRRANAHGSPDEDRDFARFILEAGEVPPPVT